jgi:hypothetical protein
MVALPKLLDWSSARARPARSWSCCCAAQVKDAEAFTDKARCWSHQAAARQRRDVVLEKDEEHGVFEIVLQQPANGHTREVRVGDAFVASPEYKALYCDLRGIPRGRRPPSTVVDGGETVIADRERAVATSWRGQARRVRSSATRAWAR